jgi:hypothetical protein
MRDGSPLPGAPLGATIAWLVGIVGVTMALPAAAQEPCFERLDNGVDTTGWQRSTTNHHGPGLGWTVEDGAIVGRQTAGQLGGILMTSRTYRDVEVVLEVKIDWGADSGLFFRTTAGDRAYQVNIDHLTGGGIGTIYGEGFATLLRARDYTLTDQGNTAVVEPGQTPIFPLSSWATIWHPTEFNEMRARIEGNPPHMQVWISNVKVMDFTDIQLRSEIDAAGPLAIQVHMGPDRWIAGGTVRFRNIRAKDLTQACVSPPDAGDARPAVSPLDAGDAGGDARPTADVEHGAEPTPDTAAPAGAAKDTAPGSDSAPVPTPARNDSGGGCACTTSRSASDERVPVLLLIVLACVSGRRRARMVPLGGRR